MSMECEIAKVDDGRFYLRNDRGQVSEYFDTAEDAKMQCSSLM